MKTKIITVVLAAIAIGSAGTIAFVTSPEPAKATNVDHSTCMPTWACGQEYAPSTTSSTTAPQLIPAVSIVRPALKATTTTSEVPPRLTPEQEAKIPSAGDIDPSVVSTDAQMEWCINTHQDPNNCKLPESEGMGEDNGNLNGTDYEP